MNSVSIHLPRFLGIALAAAACSAFDAAAQDDAAEAVPEATSTPFPNIVRSPHPPHNVVDISGFQPGETVVDPTTDLLFRVPAAAVAPPRQPPAPERETPADEPSVPTNPPPDAPDLPPTTTRAPASEDPRADLTVLHPSDISAETARRIGGFVRRYVESGESDRPEASAEFYAPTVESYFGKRGLTYDEIVADRRHFIDRWPERSYSMSAPPVIVEADPASAGGPTYRVMLSFDYRVRNGDRTGSGAASSFLDIRETPAGLRIASVEERRARKR